MQRFRGMQEVCGGAGGAERGSNLAGDKAGLADSGDDGAMAGADGLGQKVGDAVEGLTQRAVEALGEEFERVAKYGSVTPDLWMKNATGPPLSAKPMFRAAEAALEAEGKK